MLSVLSVSSISKVSLGRCRSSRRWSRAEPGDYESSAGSPILASKHGQTTASDLGKIHQATTSSDANSTAMTLFSAKLEALVVQAWGCTCIRADGAQGSVPWKHKHKHS